MKKTEFTELTKKAGDKNLNVLKNIGYGAGYLGNYKAEDDLPDDFVKKANKYFNINSKTKTEKAKEEPVKKQKTDTKAKSEKSEKPVNKKLKKGEGVGLEISNKEYHASDKLGSSKIKLILDSPFEFKRKYVDKICKQQATDAMIVGSLHHTLVLEPDKLKLEYVLINDLGLTPKDAIVKKIETLGGEVTYKENGKGVSETVPVLKEICEKLEAKETRTLITSRQVMMARATAEKALGSDFVVEKNGKEIWRERLEDVAMLDRTHVERTFYGEIDGVQVQVRPDFLVNLGASSPIWFCIDLKTAENASMQNFAKQSAQYYYDIQEWLYREIMRQNGIDIVDFRFCVAGKNENSNCAYYQLDIEDIEDAGKIVRNAIKKYKYCIENDTWEDGRFNYQNMKFESLTIVKMPTWRKFQLNDMGVFDE